jgi:ribosomal protein S12 methylthiotransferase
MSKVSIVTLGCAKNTADTDNLTRVLNARGHSVTEKAEEADTIVVHTCSFIEAAKKESINTILEAAKLKENGKKLYVTGCLVQQHGDEIFQELPEVDAFLGTGQLGQIADLLDKPKARFMDRAKPGGFMDPDIGHERKDKGIVGPSAYLRLSEGCSHPCSFCVIPRLRGPVQSRSEKTILNEARELTRLGVEEFSIIAQDTGDWGRDVQARPSLPRLLRQLGSLPNMRWIRLMYMHPASMTDDLVGVFAELPEKFPYLDMPFQHIDSDMLAQMKRKSDETSLRTLLDTIHRWAPELTLRTTFIVGAPGETEKQFERLLAFVKEGHFDYLGAFAYSKEEGTPAAQREDQIPEDEKQNRLKALTDAYYDVAHAKAQKRLGQTETILLEETEGDTVLGRTRREAPEIDAIVRLPRSAVRQGRFVQAKLTGYDAYEFSAQS